MDPSENHMNVMVGKTDSRSPSRAEPDVSYAELHFKTLSTPQVRKDRDGPNSTYSELKFRKEEPRIAEGEDPHIYFGHGALSTTAVTAAKEQDAKVKIGNRPYCLICLLCLVMSALIVIVAGLSIHVSQIRQSQITSNRNYNELNSTFQSKLFALNSNLSDLERVNSDLRRHFAEMETKYRSFNETKAQICEFLTRRREPTCSQGWIKNEGRCYFISRILKSYAEARKHCSEIDSRLLEINSEEEKKFVDRYGTWWIGKCADGNVASHLLYKYDKIPPCSKCAWSSGKYSCRSKYRFICVKSARSYPEIPEEIRGLCEQQVGSTSIK